MGLWIARDENGRLDLYTEEPYLTEWDGHGRIWDSDSDYMELPKYLYPEVTFENSPVKVELITKA
jgi:hypothetical protein